MSKAIQGVALLGGAVAIGALSLGVGGAALEALANSSFAYNAIEGLAVAGVSMEASAVAQALTTNRGIAITTRQTAAARQIVYGQRRIGGVEIYRSTTGSSNRQFNYVIVLAGHPCDSVVNLYLDGRQVHWNIGSVGNATTNGINFGGTCDGNDYVGPNGVIYNFGGNVYCEVKYGTQVSGDVIGGLTANDPNWAASASGNPYVGGCTYCYLKVTHDPNNFPSEPEIRFTINGKNNIYDPRTGTTGFTTNWALICADVITDPVFGLGDNSVNQDQLIAAANVCDEQVAIQAIPGTTEARYTTNYFYDTSVTPGNALSEMMKGAAGRLSRIGGEWFIWPAYWQGPSFSFDANALTGSMQWEPYRSFRDLVNRVTGTYIAPTYPYNVTGNLYDQNGYYNGQIQNNFPFAFQPTNFPMYAQDVLHGYSADDFLNADGGEQLPYDVSFQSVLSVTQAQRVAKIMLLRNRQQGSGTFPMSLSAWQMQPCDVMQFTFPHNGWTDKYLEVTQVSFNIQDDGDGIQSVRCQMNVQETDPSIYVWNPSDELTVYDISATPDQISYTPAPPGSLSLISSAATAITSVDGIVTPRVQVEWSSPDDALVTQVQIQYASVGTPTAWIDAGSVDVSLTSAFVSGVIAGQTYNFRIRSIRPNGAVSEWAEEDNYTVSSGQTSILSMSINPNSPFNTSNDAIIITQPDADGVTTDVVFYGPGGVGTSFTRYVGSTAITMSGGEITGFPVSTVGYLVYEPSTQTYYALTDYNQSLDDQYAFIGAFVSCALDGTGGAAGGGGVTAAGGRSPNVSDTYSGDGTTGYIPPPSGWNPQN